MFRAVVFLIASIAITCCFLVTLVVDVYLIAQSMYRGRLHEKMREYKEIMAEVMPPLEFPFAFSLDIMGFLALDINVEGGVTCTGMQAPVYLAINFCEYLS